MTTLQMVQFVGIMVHGFQLVFYDDCDFPWQFSYYIAAHAVLFFILFSQFYIQAYLTKPRKTTADPKSGVKVLGIVTVSCTRTLLSSLHRRRPYITAASTEYTRTARQPISPMRTAKRISRSSTRTPERLTHTVCPRKALAFRNALFSATRSGVEACVVSKEISYAGVCACFRFFSLFAILCALLCNVLGPSLYSFCFNEFLHCYLFCHGPRDE